MRNLSKENKILLIIKVAAVILSVFIMLIPTIYNAAENIQIEPSDLTVKNYDFTFNRTICVVDFALSKDAKGEVVVRFYNEDEESLGTYKTTVKSVNGKASPVFVLQGNASDFEIVSEKLTSETGNVIAIVFYIIGAICLLATVLLLPCREKAVEFNGKKLSVYAGFIRNYLKSDEGIIAEKKALPFLSVELEADIDGKGIKIHIGDLNGVTATEKPTDNNMQESGENATDGE